jgi:hypothetical protein
MLMVACGGGERPEDVIHRLAHEAKAGNLEGVQATMTEKSGAVFGMAWTISERYGFLPELGIRSLSAVTVHQVDVDGNRATAEVSWQEDNGQLVLVREGGGWKLDLLASGPGELGLDPAWFGAPENVDLPQEETP